MKQPYENRRVIVTGAAGGIGRALADLLLAGGAAVLAVDVDADGLKRLDQETTGDLRLLVADLSTRAGIAETSDAIGTIGRPTGLVNNAGVYRGNPLRTYSHEMIEADFRVNVVAPMLLGAAFAEACRSRDSPAVVNLASTAGEVGSSDDVYGSTKAAVIGLTKSQAMNYGPGVRVNCVSPGLVHDTAIEARIPAYRHAEYSRQERLSETRLDARSVAEVVAMLLSEVSRNLTGKIIPVDNGTYPR